MSTFPVDAKESAQGVHVIDIGFVVLTGAVFAVLGLIARAVERL